MSGGQFVIDPKTGERVRVGEPPKSLSRAERRELAAQADKKAEPSAEKPVQALPKPAAEPKSDMPAPRRSPTPASESSPRPPGPSSSSAKAASDPSTGKE